MLKVNGIKWIDIARLEKLRREYPGLKVLEKRSPKTKIPLDAPLDSYHAQKREKKALLALDSLINFTQIRRENLSQINKIQGFRH